MQAKFFPKELKIDSPANASEYEMSHPAHYSIVSLDLLVCKFFASLLLDRSVLSMKSKWIVHHD